MRGLFACQKRPAIIFSTLKNRMHSWFFLYYAFFTSISPFSPTEQYDIIKH